MISDFTSQDCNDLRHVARDFKDGAVDRKAAALAGFSGRAPADPQALVDYHDALLFLLAYPQTANLRDAAEEALSCVADLCDAAVAKLDGAALPDALHGSGLPSTRIAVSFNLRVARWLGRCFPSQTGLNTVRGDLSTLRRMLGETLPDVEFETIAAPAETPDDLLDALGAPKGDARLTWLLDQIDSLPVPEGLRREMYRDLRAFVRIDSTRGSLSRMALRGVDRPCHLHTGPLARTEDAAAILDAPLPPALVLTQLDRDRLLTAARGLLALLGRQTDPISDCDGQGVYAYDLGRGVVIGLYSAAPGDRPPLDSHIGMMLFKNGMPVAYGGGWPFLGTCKIGINIFEPYRGGESQFLFLSVLRAYRHLFGVKRFIVERYQFGRNNPEGIASGAYWFYYRLGFRSMSDDLAALAEEEWAQISAGDYKTPRDVLERFTERHMQMRLQGCPPGYGYTDPADLSYAVTRAIRTEFGGDRAAFLGMVNARMNDALPGAASRAPRALADLGPVLALIPHLDRWPQGDRDSLIRLLEARESPDERDFFAIMSGHDRLVAALEEIGR